MRKSLPLVVALLACCPAQGAAQADLRPVQRVGAASVWLPAGLGKPLSLRLSQEFLVTLRVEGPAPLEVELLDPEYSPGEAWEAQRRQVPAQKQRGENRGAVWQAVYLVAPVRAGDHLLELPALRYRSGEAEWREVKWAPLKLRVTTRIKDADPEKARDILPVEELPPEERKPSWVRWGAVAVGAAALFGVAALLARRRGARRQPALTPEQWARAELQRLAASEPTGEAAVERFHREVSAVLRGFLERRHYLPAERRTTAEFLRLLQSASALPPAAQATLGDLLTRCDLAKFARVVPSVEECRTLASEARDFVERAAAVDPTGADGQGLSGS